MQGNPRAVEEVVHNTTERGAIHMAESITVMTTGGTIATPRDYRQRRLSAKDLAEALNSSDQRITDAHVAWKDFASRPSNAITCDDVLSLLDRMEKEIAEGAKAVVITHGTDFMEETAYLLSLFWEYDQPVILTGAMRSAGSISADGPRNLEAALRTAESPRAQGRGPLLVFHDKIYATGEISKVHSWDTDAFAAELGPLGTINQWNELHFQRETIKRKTLPRPTSLTEPVALITASMDTSEAMVDALVSGGYRGLVIQGGGRGSLPPRMMEAAKYAADNGVHIVIASRCAFGGTSPGSLSPGIIRAGNLNGVKARLLLLVAISLHGYDRDKIRETFDAH